MTRWGLVVAALAVGLAATSVAAPDASGADRRAADGARRRAVVERAGDGRGEGGQRDPADRGGVRHGVAGVDSRRARPARRARGHGRRRGAAVRVVAQLGHHLDGVPAGSARRGAGRPAALREDGSRSSHGAPATDPHAAHVDPASPVQTLSVPIRMTPAFNRHPLVGQIVADRAGRISTAPGAKRCMLVAHGPVPDDDNRRWLEDMAVLAEAVRAVKPFAVGRIHDRSRRRRPGDAGSRHAGTAGQGRAPRSPPAGACWSCPT